MEKQRLVERFHKRPSPRGPGSQGLPQVKLNLLRSLCEDAATVPAISFPGPTRGRARTVPGVAATKTWLLASLIFFNLALSVELRAQLAPSEYRVKAAYLFDFLKFVEWPEDSFADPLAPIVVGVVGEDPFGSALPEVVIGKTVQGRDLVLRRYRVGEDLRGAHLLFISASERKQLPQILSSVRGSSVLTVADTEGFLEAGGMIQFLSENNQIHFAVNVDAASKARLKMSSRLLTLAKGMGGKVRQAGN